MTKRPTKKEQTKEIQFSEEISPLIDQITDLCDKYSMPLLVAVQLYTNKTEGARVAAQSIETNDTTLPLALSTKLLRGEARITADSDTSFYVNVADDNGNYTTDFDESQLESLEEHAAHCNDCQTQLATMLENGEDVSNVLVSGDHADFPMDGFEDGYNTHINPITLLPKNPLSVLGMVLQRKKKTLH